MLPDVPLQNKIQHAEILSLEELNEWCFEERATLARDLFHSSCHGTAAGLPSRCALSLRRFRGRISARDSALHRAPGQAMQTESSGRLSPAIEPGNHFAIHVHHLALCIDAESGARVVNHRSGPCRIK